MGKRIFVIITLALFVYISLPLVLDFIPTQQLSYVSQKYVQDGPEEVGAQNLVTAIIVTYRGLDTLGEVAVLFIATAGIGFILSRKKWRKRKKRSSSSILQTGTQVLLPLIIMFGIYVFTNGHLTPGGGFQGGVIIASGILVYILASPKNKFKDFLISLTESISGFGYVLLGLLGLILAAGFLDNSILPLGKFGRLFSAGAIPLIYSLIGLKVGSELVNILKYLRRD
ncbi:MAG: sodium:proton antiporter [Candidatus Cloacimonetes bacterium]|nr:sodium:proton antiporter [Candidatus Cloacimonadota bacterium]